MVAPLTPDEARLAAIREALPAVNAGIYLNAAAAGPLPVETARAMADEAAREATLGRAHPRDAEETIERVGEARAAMAAVLGADLRTVALTRGTAHGLELACMAVPWRKGDRAVFVVDEHDPSPWPRAWLRGLGVDVVELPMGDRGDAIVDDVQAARKNAKLIGLPHVLGSTGERLPVVWMSGIAHGAGAIFVLDASQSVGARDVDLESLNADLVAFPSERWLLGPAGLGGLQCHPRVLDRVTALYPDGFTEPAPVAASGHRGAPPGPAAWHRPSVVGFARSCGLLAMQIGLPWAWARAELLAERAAEALRSIDGVQVLTPVDMATIVSFRIQGWHADAALDELGARIFVIGGRIPSLDAIRISPGAWNTEAEIDGFAEAVALLASHTPETLPPRRTLEVLG